MKLSGQEQALEAFHSRYPSEIVAVCDVVDKSSLGQRPRYVHAPLPAHCWFVLFVLRKDLDLTRLRDSRLVVIDKDTGQIVSDGCACDEG
jgi:hypothetical protein